jgi:hypothetical protein
MGINVEGLMLEIRWLGIRSETMPKIETAMIQPIVLRHAATSSRWVRPLPPCLITTNFELYLAFVILCFLSLIISNTNSL